MDKDTRIIIYSKEERGFTTEIEGMFAGLAPLKDIEVFETLADLMSRLSTPHGLSAVLLLFISDAEDLKNVQAIQPLFTNMRIILVLPDHAAGTIAAGHCLFPRFVCFKDEALENMRSVLGRMLKNDAGQPVSPQGGLQV